jgi:glycine dehydrogenase subunit 1
MYDGATSVAEAAVMAVNHTSRHTVVVAGPLHPEYADVLRTYGAGRGFEVVLSDPLGTDASGVCSPDELSSLLGEGVAAVIVQQPSFLGTLQPAGELSTMAHDAGALVIGVADPVAAAIIEPPGAWGADIAAGEAQQLGMPLWFGGPYLGYLACRADLVRRLPGRLVGESRDHQGRRGFLLTLQAREQHIRRERATSNICTNHALMALAAAVHLASLGPQGLTDVARTSLSRAQHLRNLISPLYPTAHSEPSLWEFAVRCPVPAARVAERMRTHRILPGYDLGRYHPALADCLLIAVTEMNSPDSLERFAAALMQPAESNGHGTAP